MEFALLVKVGIVVGCVVKGGYAIAGSYLLRTAYKYVQDYRYYVSIEKE